MYPYIYIHIYKIEYFILNSSINFFYIIYVYKNNNEIFRYELHFYSRL